MGFYENFDLLKPKTFWKKSEIWPSWGHGQKFGTHWADIGKLLYEIRNHETVARKFGRHWDFRLTLGHCACSLREHEIFTWNRKIGKIRYF